MTLLELSECLKNQAVRRNPDKIAIIVLYGSTAREKDNKFSDLDMYAIVDDNEDTDLPWEFIFQGHTVDFWKMDWKQAETMALGKENRSPWAVSAALFTKGKILYSRSNSDKIRFNLLIIETQRKEEDNLKQIMADFNSGYSHLEEIKIAQKNSDLLSARWAAWQLINKTVRNLSLANNSFLMKNWGSNLHEAFHFSSLPDNYQNLVTALSTTDNFVEMVDLGRELMMGMREMILKKQQNIVIDETTEDKTCNNYISMKAYVNKILSACNKKDILAVSYAATELQIWIAEELAHYEGNQIVDVDNFNFFEEIKTFYLKLMLPNLMEGISKKDFQKIEKNATKLNFMLQEFCKNRDMEILRFDDIGEVQKYLNDE
ncbi:MAG: hypothetical protein JSW11_17745 [Candidatus Heimdallarchaeota archaeon]|nr:MAG: hypothetical protein JSW11_17745 [Candidatus Heimdallarchaeota archaeon]